MTTHSTDNCLNSYVLELIFDIMQYCSTVWIDNSCTLINKLHKMQKRAAQVITGSGYEIRSRETFGWKPIENILKKRKLTMTFKAIRDKQPGLMSEVFKFNHNDMYQLSSNDCKLYLKKPHTDFMKESFSCRGASAFNDPPNNVVKMQWLTKCKSFKTLMIALVLWDNVENTGVAN